MVGSCGVVCYSAWRAGSGGSRSLTSLDLANCGRTGHLTYSYSGISLTATRATSLPTQVTVALLGVLAIVIFRERLGAGAKGVANIDRALCGSRPRPSPWRVAPRAIATRGKARSSIDGSQASVVDPAEKGDRIVAGRRVSRSTRFQSPGRFGRRHRGHECAGRRRGERVPTRSCLDQIYKRPAGTRRAQVPGHLARRDVAPRPVPRLQVGARSRGLLQEAARGCVCRRRDPDRSGHMSVTRPSTAGRRTWSSSAPVAPPCPSTPPT